MSEGITFYISSSKNKNKNLPNNRFENLVDLLLFPAKPFLGEIPKVKLHDKKQKPISDKNFNNGCTCLMATRLGTAQENFSLLSSTAG